MDSPQNNKSADELINWNTPEYKNNNNNNTHNYSINYINNPFDLLELKAASNSGANNEELNYIKHINDNAMWDKPKNDHFTIYANEKYVNKPKENSLIVNDVFNKVEKETQIFEFDLIPNYNEEDIENSFLYNEEEKNRIREKTRQRIVELIKEEKLRYKERNSRHSIFCTPPRNSNELSLNKTENEFNRGFIQGCSENNLINFNKTFSNINDNNESIFCDQDLNYIDLNSIQPEWVEDEFSDFDESLQIFKTNKSVSITESTDVGKQLKMLNCIGNCKYKQNGFQIYKDNQFKESNHITPVASSTPTSDIATILKNPLSGDFSIKSKSSLSQQSVNSIDSPKTPLNSTRCIKASSTNITTVLPNEVNKKNATTIKTSFKLNKSKSESKININKKLSLSTNNFSGLPVRKQSTMKFKGKENMKPQ